MQPTTGISFSFVQLYNQSIHTRCVCVVCTKMHLHFEFAWRCRCRLSLLTQTAAAAVTAKKIVWVYSYVINLVDLVYVTSEYEWD